MLKLFTLVAGLVASTIAALHVVTPQHLFDNRDIVTYRLTSDIRYEIRGMYPSADGEMLYYITPIDGAYDETICVYETALQSAD